MGDLELALRRGRRFKRQHVRRKHRQKRFIRRISHPIVCALRGHPLLRSGGGTVFVLGQPPPDFQPDRSPWHGCMCGRRRVVMPDPGSN